MIFTFMTQDLVDSARIIRDFCNETICLGVIGVVILVGVAGFGVITYKMLKDL